MKYERNYFTFAGVCSKDYGVYTNGGKTFNSPERKIDQQTIPGRNGDLLIESGRLTNLSHTYEAFIFENFRVNLSEFQNHLLSQIGYQRLEDTYHPDEFYLAVYNSGMEVATSGDLHVGTFTVTFNRKPQRFLKSGEQVHTFLSSGNLFNPTKQVAKPLIRVYGTGSLTIAGEVIEITSNPGYIDLDSEIEDAHMGATNCNGLIRLASDDFPLFQPGRNSIGCGSGISKVEITPRWWRA